MEIEISLAVPPDTIRFVSPRKGHYVVLPSGERFRVWEESEEAWAKRCAIITGLKT